jgi:hypothetical protein
MYIKFDDYINEKLNRRDFKFVEDFVDKLFPKHGIDVEFTKHFMERVNDDRNVRDITVDELTKLFSTLYKEYGDKIANSDSGYEACVKDMESYINIPLIFKQDYDKDSIVLKTAMRKKDFKTDFSKCDDLIINNKK